MRKDLHMTKHNTEDCWYRDYCEKFGTEDCCWKCRKMQQTKFLLDLSNLSRVHKRPLALDIRKVNKEAGQYINEVLSDPEFFVKRGYNAYFYGPTGTGKTSWACKILLNYFSAIAETNNSVCRGLFISVPELLRDLKFDITHPDNMPDFVEFVHTIQDTDLVVWDEIGDLNYTNYECQWVYSFVNHRIANKRANIFVGNCTPETLSAADPALYSRICTGSDCIEFDGMDLRVNNTFSSAIAEYLQDNPGIFDLDSENYQGIPPLSDAVELSLDK